MEQKGYGAMDSGSNNSRQGANLEDLLNEPEEQDSDSLGSEENNPFGAGQGDLRESLISSNQRQRDGRESKPLPLLNRPQLFLRFLSRELFPLYRLVFNLRQSDFQRGPLHVSSGIPLGRLGLLNGLTGFVQNLWVPAFWLMSFYDWVNYQRLSHYLASSSDVFLGVSPNHDANHGALTSHLGSDLPTETLYHAGIGAVWASVILFGVINTWHYRSRYLDDIDFASTRISTEDRNVSDNIIRDTVAAVPVAGDLGRCLAALEVDVLFPATGSDANTNREDSLNRIINVAKNFNYVTQLRAISSLANVVDNLEDKELRQVAYEALEDISNANPHLFARLYAHYLLATIARPTHRAWVMPVMVMVFLTLWAEYQLARITMRKMIGDAHYRLEKHDCEQDGLGHYALEKVIGNYDCVISPEVYYPLAKNIQGVLTATLAVNTPPKIIIRRLQQIITAVRQTQASGVVTELNLAHQSWTTWKVEEFATVLNLLAHPALVKQWQVYNLSLLEQAKLPVAHAQILAAHLPALNLTRLWINNVDLSKQLNVLTPALSNLTRLTDLSFANANLVDEDLIALTNSSISTQLESFNLANNVFGQAGLMALKTIVSHSKLRTLNLAANSQLTADELMLFLTVLPDTEITTLILDGINLNLLDIDDFGQALQNSSVETLSLKNTEIDDFFLSIITPYLANSTVSSLDLAGNGEITDAVDFFKTSAGRIVEINFDKTSLSDESVTTLCELANQTDYRAWSFAGVPIETSSINCLLMHLPDSLERLNLNYLDLSASVDALIQAFSNRTHGFTSVNLRAAQLTEGVMATFLQALPNFNLTAIDLSENEFGVPGGVALLEFVKQPGMIKKLSINNIDIPTTAFTQVLRTFPHSSLIEFNAANNPFHEDALIEFAREMVDPFPENQYLGDPLSKDAFRVLSRTPSHSVLEKLNLSNAAQTVSLRGAQALCQVLYRTSLSILMVQLPNVTHPNGQSKFLECADILGTDDSVAAGNDVSYFSTTALLLLTLLVTLAGVLGWRQLRASKSSIDLSSAGLFTAHHGPEQQALGAAPAKDNSAYLI